jgi:hypothetical protein
MSGIEKSVNEDESLENSLAFDRKTQLSKDFLLAELSETGEFWRHTDGRIESAINFYITVAAVVLPASVLIYQSISDIATFILLALLLGILLIIMGIFLIARISNAEIRKSQYILSIQLIRSYFVNRDPEIAQYLLFPAAIPSYDQTEKENQLEPFIQRRLVIIINALNSLMIGACIYALLWLLASMSAGLAFILAAVAAIASLLVSDRIYNKSVRRYREELPKRS